MTVAKCYLIYAYATNYNLHCIPLQLYDPKLQLYSWYDTHQHNLSSSEGVDNIGHWSVRKNEAKKVHLSNHEKQACTC